jgi:hypothetical protein
MHPPGQAGTMPTIDTAARKRTSRVRIAYPTGEYLPVDGMMVPGPMTSDPCSRSRIAT